MTSRSRLFAAFASCPHPPATHIVRSGSDEDSARVRDVLAHKTVSEISVSDVTTLFEGRLWMLTPEAFLHYLPAMMDLSLTAYDDVGTFAAELVSALTEPSRADVVEALDRLDEVPSGLGLDDALTAELRRQQLEWFDSGAPTALFHDRFDEVTVAEGKAILGFLEALRRDHAASFPFGELDRAIDRRWSEFRSS